MSDNYLITGYWGKPHVTPENDRGINAAAFGAGRFVLPVGERFRAEYIGNNTVRMHDGKLMDNGAAAGIPAGDYVDLYIANASQGMARNDLIIFNYAKDPSTLVESGTFIVRQGEETSGAPMDPAIEQQDLMTDTASIDQMPLWRVSVNGTSISAPVQLFEVSRDMRAIEDAAMAHAQRTNNPHKVTPAQIGAAASGHGHALTDDAITGVAPITKGGTGAANAVAARANLGVTPENIGAAASGHGRALSDNTITGTLPVAKGGTGATDAGGARTNLGITPGNIGAVKKSGDTMSGSLNITKSNTSETAVIVTNNNGSVALSASSSRGIYDNGNRKWVVQSAPGSTQWHFYGEADNVSGVVSVANGGTGAATGLAALKNLGLEICSGKAATASGSTITPTKSVAFDFEFSATPSVVVTAGAETVGKVWVTNVTASGCTIYSEKAGAVYWVAVRSVTGTAGI